MSMEDKLLMEYDFIPDPEFPDKNLWTYNQFVFAVDQRRNRLFTSWNTYPPRPNLSCLMLHNIQTNETQQGQFYNITLTALHFDFNNQHLFAIGTTRDDLLSLLWEVDQNTLTLRKLIDLTSQGQPQVGSTFDILENILYYRTETALIGIEMKTLMIKTICKLDSNPYLNNLFVINEQFYTIYNWRKAPSDFTISNLTIKQLDRTCRVNKQLDIEQPTSVAVMTGRVLDVDKNQIVFSYDDNFSMFGHDAHVLIVDVGKWKVINDVQKRFASSPYELIYVSSTKK
ncbi:unnamed protein product [Rotaria sordida]|uniref:Uncharacterized protein n=1 Tax=Rotaria sordida TaxID=392033 RepID=A0A814QNU6_9BILA|nr:unnamed protein product [Rotaria sordida]